jgi:post-segregation antitoxin (ccd killing protein)
MGSWWSFAHAEHTVRRCPHDVAAKKRTVSLTLNSDLYARARAAGMNVSSIAEAALAQAVRAREAEALRDWLFTGV